MHPDFSFVLHHGIEVLVYTPWWEVGVLHGMTTRQLSFDRSQAPNSAARLCAALGVEGLVLPTQVHGSTVLDLRGASLVRSGVGDEGYVLRQGECDAVLCASRGNVASCAYAVGVLSADCVPIIVRGASSVVLIHAGWRGLANGVIAKGVRALDVPQDAVVMACAGIGRYQVGNEVLEAIGGSAVYQETPQGVLLDTGATAIKQLQAVAPGLQVVSAEICTISDPRFHSHRRDASLAGRCVTFFCPPR
jgi:copper oxidase (laccase) domain-containing protein